MTDLIINITLLLIISIRVSRKWIHIKCIDIRAIRYVELKNFNNTGFLENIIIDYSF